MPAKNDSKTVAQDEVASGDVASEDADSGVRAVGDGTGARAKNADARRRQPRELERPQGAAEYAAPQHAAAAAGSGRGRW